MSFSWVDPHFAVLYARREEERLAERLVTRMREPAACEDALAAVPWAVADWEHRRAPKRWIHHLRPL